MNAKKILTATKKMTFNQAIAYVKSIGFELTLAENFPFLVSFNVKN